MAEGMPAQPIEPILSEALMRGEIPENANESTIFMLSYIREKAILKLYKEAMLKIEFPQAKKIFHALMNEKKKYQSVLNEYLEQINPHDSSAGSIEKFILDYKLFLEKLKTGTDMLDVFQYAMNVEKTSFDFYENALEICRNNTLKKLFKILLDCERHYYQYLLMQFAS